MKVRGRLSQIRLSGMHGANKCISTPIYSKNQTPVSVRTAHPYLAGGFTIESRPVIPILLFRHYLVLMRKTSQTSWHYLALLRKTSQTTWHYLVLLRKTSQTTTALSCAVAQD